MTSTYGSSGRLCNHVFRSLCVSLIAKKHNLCVEYEHQTRIEKLGIDLFSGNIKHTDKREVNDFNFFDVLNSETIDYNLNTLYSYFQTKEISLYLYNYLHEEATRNTIIQRNPFKDRINSNNDCFIHVRLTDTETFGPGLPYYLKALSMLNFDTLYIASDDLNHSIIKNIMDVYPNSKKIELNEVETIQFGSTNKYLVLSPGTFSAVIGYLSTSHTILYPGIYKLWHGDIFSIPGWTKIIDYNKTP
jgi:hypothetical protein